MANLTAGNNLAIKAENIRVDAAYESADTQSEMDRYQAGFNLNASKSNVSITVGGSLAESETGNQSTTAVGSSLSAGNDLSLDAANDIAIIGSDIEAGNDLALLAGDEIFIGAAESTSHQTSDSHSASFGGGLSFGQEGTGIVISAAYGMAEQDREGVSYSNSHLSAGNGLTLRSGGDTTIEGGNLLGNTVDMDIGGDLTLASLQDSGHVDGKRMDVSASVTIGIGFNASAGYGETSGSKAWVNEQSRIIGRESVNVQVDGHTQLTGALIANIDEHGVDQGNLYLDTGSFGYEDLTDHDNEQSDYVSVGFGTSDNPDTAQQESGNSWTIGGEFYERDREQINRATVGQGTLIVGGDRVNLDGLNRDTDIAQEITRDVESETTLYASSTAVDSLGNLATSPAEQFSAWKDDFISSFDPDTYKNLADRSVQSLYLSGVIADDMITRGLDESAAYQMITNGEQVTQEKLDIAHSIQDAHQAATDAVDEGVTVTRDNETGLLTFNHGSYSETYDPETGIRTILGNGYSYEVDAPLSDTEKAAARALAAEAVNTSASSSEPLEIVITSGASYDEGWSIFHKAINKVGYVYNEYGDSEVVQQSLTLADMAMKLFGGPVRALVSVGLDEAVEQAAEKGAFDKAVEIGNSIVVDIATFMDGTLAREDYDRALNIERMSDGHGHKEDTHAGLVIIGGTVVGLSAESAAGKLLNGIISFKRVDGGSAHDDLVSKIDGSPKVGANRKASESVQEDGAHVIIVDRNKYPESAKHIEDAKSAGQPVVLTVDRAGAAKRRKESLRNTHPVQGKDRDEYPPAMFKEGGSGASIRLISPSDNRGAGACIGIQCRKLSDGTSVIIKTGEENKK